jgi:hypothetical protein
MSKYRGVVIQAVEESSVRLVSCSYNNDVRYRRVYRNKTRGGNSDSKKVTSM